MQRVVAVNLFRKARGPVRGGGVVLGLIILLPITMPRRLCLQGNTTHIPAIQYNSKKLNWGQLLWPAACMLINKVSDDACQWNGHDDDVVYKGLFTWRWGTPGRWK